MLLGFGITGLTLMHTGVIHNPTSQLSEALIEPAPPGSLPDESGQAAVEGKLSTVPQNGAPAVGQSTTPQATAQGRLEDQTEAEKPVPVPRMAQGPRRYPSQNQVLQPSPSSRKPPARSAETASHTERSVSRGYTRPAAAPEKRVITVRVALDPVRKEHIRIARVHTGDRVSIRIRHTEASQGRVYLAFNTYRDFMRRPYDYRMAPSAVITPVRDDDRLTLTPSRQFGSELSRRLASKQGAILEIGTDYAPYQGPFIRRLGFEPGRFEIEIRIYGDNKWNIKPRSLL